MPRLLIIFLLALMPFQLVWATAAGYCAHESRLGDTQHFGHHDHEHQDKTAMPSGGNDDADGVHPDCEICHLGTSVTLPGVAMGIAPIPGRAELHTCDPDYTSHVPSGPERPDRTIPPLPCDSVATSARPD